MAAAADTAPSPEEAFGLLLANCDVVSFDFFDTLVHRPGLLSPKDLFPRVGALARQRLGLDVPDFAALRVRAEANARARAAGRGEGEVRLGEIYAELCAFAGVAAELAPRLAECEVDCEREAVRALPAGRALFELARAAGKTVVVVSDTYLDEEVIRELAEREGFAPDRILVSSAARRTKASGGLLESLPAGIGCPRARVLHVGDDRFSDVTAALGAGLRAHWRPTRAQLWKWRHGLDDRATGSPVLSALAAEAAAGDGGLVEELGVLFAGFAAWLAAQLRASGARRVCFAARDGHLMQRFFALLAEREGLLVETRYLQVSRAAAYPALIFAAPETARRAYCRNWDRLTVESALRRLSVPLAACEEALARHGLTSPETPMNTISRERFRSLLAGIWPLVEEHNRERFELLVEYLRQERVLAPERVAFVDIGWHGSVQNALLAARRHLGVDEPMDGFYLGTFERPEGAESGFRSRGFLVDDDEPPALRELVRTSPSLVELFHGAPHGTVVGYRRAENGVVPVHAADETELRQYRETIQPLQESAYAFVERTLARLPELPLGSPDPWVVAQIGLRVVRAPSLEEATRLGSLTIASDFGGRPKSLTGVLEWPLAEAQGDRLPDGTFPMWGPGFRLLRERALAGEPVV